MKFFKYLLIVSTFVVANSTLSFSLLPKSQFSNPNLATSICKIANDITNSKNVNQDILISNLGGKPWSTMLNNILQCIESGKIVVIANIQNKIIEKSLRKASLVIIVGLDMNDMVLMSKIITNSQQSSIYSHLTNIICIVHSSTTQKRRINTLMNFSSFGFLNVALVYESPNSDVSYEILNAQRNSMTELLNPQNSSLVFPDKLRNLHGFQYTIAVIDQPSSLKGNEKFVSSYMLHFFQILKDIQKADFKITILDDFKTLERHWKTRKFHLCLNTATVTNAPDPKLQTYETKSHCALIPIPPKTSFYRLIFIKSFDNLVWILFGVSVVSFVVVWRMFQGRGAVDSHWKLAVGIFMMFVGQDADFSRQNRFVLAVLLNIISLSVFLLSNLYEGVITSFIIEPMVENRLKTIEDLHTSEYSVKSTKAFAYQYENSSLVENLKSRLNSSDDFVFANSLIDHISIYIRTCTEADSLLTKQNQHGISPSEYYYILQEKLTFEFIRLEASFLNPFIDSFQYYMDLSFQAGLPHMWKVFESHERLRNIESTSNNQYVEFKDLEPIFGTLLILWIWASLVLLIEIFYRDCLENIKKFEIKSWLPKWLKMKNEKRKMENRIINVQPLGSVA